MSNNKSFYYGFGFTTAIAFAYFYLKNKKKNATNSNSTNTGNVGETNTTGASKSKSGGISGIIESVLGSNSTTNDADNPKIDTTTKGYKKTNDALTKWKLFMRDYRMDGLNLRDSNSDKVLGKEATETAYVFATKELASIEKGVKADKSLNDVQKVLLLDKIKSYYNDFLPLFFDKSRYNMDADWYKKAISKMTLVDYYK